MIYLVACDKGPTGYVEKTDYLKIQNNTNYEVTMGVFNFNKNDTFIIEYSVLPNQTSPILDTFISDYGIGGDIGGACEIKYINPNAQNYENICVDGFWDSPSTSIAYNFEGIKLTKLQRSRVVSYSDCDTSTTNLNVCNIGIVEEFSEKINKTNSKVTTTTTYIITNQQFLLADSL